MVLEMKKTFSKQVKQSKINNINVKDIINGEKRYMSQYESRINKENIKRSNIEIYNLLNKSNGYENFINTVSSLKLTLSSIIDAKVYEDTLIVFAEGIVITNKGLIANTVGTNNMALTTKVNGKYISKNIVIAKMFCEGTGRVCYKDGNKQNLSANNLYFSSTIIKDKKKSDTKKKVETPKVVAEVIEKKVEEPKVSEPEEKEEEVTVKFSDEDDKYSMINANIKDLIISNFDYRIITDERGYRYNAVSVKDIKNIYCKSNNKDELKEKMRKYILNRYCGMLTKYGLNIMGAKYDNGKIIFISHGSTISVSPKIPKSSDTKFITDIATNIMYNKYEWEAKRYITPFVIKAKEIEKKEENRKDEEKTFASMVSNNELKDIGPSDTFNNNLYKPSNKPTIIVGKDVVTTSNTGATIKKYAIGKQQSNQPDDDQTVGVEAKADHPFGDHDISEAITIGENVIFSNGDMYDFEGKKTDGIMITSIAVIAELYRKLK